MELLLIYLREKSKGIVIFFLFTLIYFIIFYLYRLPLEAVIYPTIICGFLGLLYLIIDFYKIKNKYLTFKNIKVSFNDLVSSLPKITTLEDEEYQKIINELCQEELSLEARMTDKHDEMINYYTLWVHQIKTPIASMTLTLKNEDTPVSRKLFSEVVKIEQYVEMVLVYLRLNSDNTDYLIKEYPLDEIIRKGIKRFSTSFIEKEIKIDYRSIDYKVITDLKWFSFVIEQVLSNSLKYTTNGTISIYMVGNELCIEDSGIGIDPSDLPRIFEYGYTGNIGRLNIKSSGLGLYLCKSICDKLNHNIYATSKVGVGTTIHIDLSQYKLNNI